MLSSQADPKDLPDWQELDYFHRPRPLTRWRRRLAWGSLVAGAVLCALLVLTPFVGPRALQPIYQARPVSQAHTFFNDDCAQCHKESFRPLGRLAHGDDFRSVEDATCLHCHDGAIHHPEQTETPSCATCHREHLGRPQLARVPDPHCTACHADTHTRSGKATFAARVTAFPDDHPEFGAWRGGPLTDPGTVRFNHKVHLNPEGVLVPPDEALAGEGPARRRLDCTSCHEPDAAGRYIKPVTYERHCASCHPLSARVVGEAIGAKAQAAAQQFARVPVPHREPELVRAVLRQRYTDFAREHRQGPERLAPDPGGSPLPGPRRPQPVTEEQAQWVGRELAEAERLLFDLKGGCAYCHTPAGPPDRSGLPRYEKSSMPERWFPHSRFDHTAHRMLSCVSCHGGASESTATADVLMPTLNLCQKCHAPKAGARHDCAECHRYHDRARSRGLNGPVTPEGLGR